jgi:hypothetical protein
MNRTFQFGLFFFFSRRGYVEELLDDILVYRKDGFLFVIFLEDIDLSMTKAIVEKGLDRPLKGDPGSAG